MSHYTVNYGGLGKAEADKKAIEGTKFYLSGLADAWEALMYDMGRVECIGTAEAFQQVNIALGFIGVQGFPVHALGRAYMLTAYRAWMADGENPIMTDDKGYAIEEPKEGA